MDKVIKHGIQLSTSLDPSSQKELRTTLETIFSEAGSKLDFNTPQNRANIENLAKAFQSIFTKAGNTSIDFSKIMKMPSDKMFAELGTIAATQFWDAWNSVASRVGTSKGQMDFSAQLDKLIKQRDNLMRKQESIEKKNRIKTEQASKLDKSYGELINDTYDKPKTLSDTSNLASRAKEALAAFREAEGALIELDDQNKVNATSLNKWLSAAKELSLVYNTIKKMGDAQRDSFMSQMSRGDKSFFAGNSFDKSLDFGGDILEGFIDKNDVGDSLDIVNKQLAQVNAQITQLTSQHPELIDKQKAIEAEESINRISEAYDRLHVKSGANKGNLSARGIKDIVSALNYAPKSTGNYSLTDDMDSVKISKIAAQEQKAYKQLDALANQYVNSEGSAWEKRAQHLLKFIREYEAQVNNPTMNQEMTKAWSGLYQELKPMEAMTQNMLQNVLNMANNMPVTNMNVSEEDGRNAAINAQNEADADAKSRAEADAKVKSDIKSAEASKQAAIAAEQERAAKEASAQATEKQAQLNNKIGYHYGNLFGGKSGARDTFGQTLDNLTVDAKPGSPSSYGYGILGGGLFYVDNPNLFGDQAPSKGSKFINGIDFSKYNLYLANTEERVANLASLMSNLQRFAVKQAVPAYTGFDQQLSGVSIDTLWQQMQVVFENVNMTKQEFNQFIQEMIRLLQSSGAYLEKETGELAFSNIPDAVDNSDNMSTRLLKRLGYQGVSTAGTSFNGINQGSVLFDFQNDDIIAFFDKLDTAIQHYNKTLTESDPSKITNSLEIVKEIDAIIERINAHKSIMTEATGGKFDTSGYDATLKELAARRAMLMTSDENVGKTQQEAVAHNNNSGAIKEETAAQERLNQAEGQNPPAQDDSGVHDANAKAIMNEADAYDYLFNKTVQALEKNNNTFDDYEQMLAQTGGESIDEYRNNRDVYQRARALVEEGFIDQQTEWKDNTGIHNANAEAINVEANAQERLNVAETKNPVAQSDSGIHNENASAIQNEARAQEQLAAKIKETQSLIKNQQAWLKTLDPYLNDANYATTGKKAATDQLRDATQRLINYRRNPEEYTYESMAEQKRVVDWNKAYQEAQRQGVADSTLTKYYTDATSQYEEALQALQKERDYRAQVLKEAEAELQVLQQQANTQNQINTAKTQEPKSTDDTSQINNENGAVAQQVQSYEQLCQVVEKYNQLVAQGGIKSPADMDVYDGVADSLDGVVPEDQLNKFKTPLDINTLAQQLGIEVPQAAQQVANAINEVAGAQERLNQAEGQNPQTSEAIKREAISYDELRQKVEAYFKIRQQMTASKDMRLSSALDAAKADITNLFPKTGDGVTATASTISNMFASTKWNVDNTLEYLASLLGVEIPQAANASKQAVDGLNNSLEKQNTIENSDNSTAEVSEENAETQAIQQQNQALQENINLKQQSNAQTGTAVVDTGITPSGVTTDGGADVAAESTQLANLQSILAAVTTAVGAKTQAFTAEEAEVKRVVASEIGSLNELEQKVLSIKGTLEGLLSNLKTGQSDVGAGLGNITVTVNKTDGADAEQKGSWALDTTVQSVRTSLDGVRIDLGNVISAIGNINTQPSDTNSGATLATESTLGAVKAVLDAINGKIVAGTKGGSSKQSSGKTDSSSEKKTGTSQKKSDGADTSKKDTAAQTKHIEALQKEIGARQGELANATNDRVRQALQEEIALREHIIQLIQKGSAMSAQEEARQIKDLSEKTKAAKEAAKEETKAQKKAAADQQKVQKKAYDDFVKETRKEAGLSQASSTINKAHGTLTDAALIDNKTPEATAKVQQLHAALEQLRATYAEINSKPGPVKPEDQQRLIAQRENVQQLQGAVAQLVEEHQRLNGVNAQQIGTTSLGLGASSEAQQKAITDAVMAATKGRAAIKGFNADTNELTYTLKTGANQFTVFKAAIDRTNGSIMTVRGNTTQALGVFASIGKKIKEYSYYFTGSMMIYRAIAWVREGITAIKEIDTALTELKKVTDATEESYEKFLDTAAKTADKVGSTIKEVVSSTADWARLNI